MYAQKARLVAVSTINQPEDAARRTRRIKPEEVNITSASCSYAYNAC